MRLHRLLQVLALLRGPSAWNTRRLAEHFAMSRRNVARDLDVLRLAGVPLYFDPEHGEGGGFRIREGFFFPHIGLTDEECLNLAVLTRAAESKGIPLLDEACSVRDKILSTLPAKQQDLIIAASELFDVLSLGLAEHGHCRQIMMRLQQALLTHKQVKATYRSPHQPREVKLQLQPRRIFLAGQAWYLAAHDNRDRQTKLYRIARFKDMTVLDRPITAAEPFSLREFIGNAWSVHATGLWPVAVTGSREPLHTAVLRGIQLSLSLASLDKRVTAGLSQSVEQLLAVAATGRLPRDQEVLDALQGFMDLVTTKAPSTRGMLLVIDELGKLLEFAAANPRESDTGTTTTLTPRSPNSHDNGFCRRNWLLRLTE